MTNDSSTAALTKEIVRLRQALLVVFQEAERARAYRPVFARRGSLDEFNRLQLECIAEVAEKALTT